MISKSGWIFIVGFLIGSAMKAQENIDISATWEWEFSQDSSSKWMPAVVPGLIHQSLLANRLITDPRLGTSEQDVQWVGESGWKYRTRPFEVDEEILSHEHIELVFEGLDTYAEVFINGERILQTDNAFRTWTADVKSFLQKRKNVIEIVFRSPIAVGSKKLKEYDHPIPGDGMRAVTRKPQFHYGWDWGPKLIGCGITGNISIRAWNNTYVSDFHINARIVTDSLVEGVFQWQVYSHKGGRITIKCGEEEVSDYVRQGWDTLERPFTVNNPRLWFCRGLGEASLYTFFWELYENDEFIQQGFKTTGFRSIELVRERDEAGETFYFRLNGIPVFIRGANYIPHTFFPSSDHEKNHMGSVLASAADVNMNMIRVWGGGVYESDEFYNECDRLGLMVWQDFMFACSMYPGDDAFISNVAEEAGQQVLRLRHHPSIALWCGNNENAEGWERWGWQMGLSRKSKDSLENAYKRLFHEVLPDIVNSYTDLDYWPSSPSYGRGDARHQFEGDSHYWGVWHDAEPFEILEEKVPRFMSEFGMQAYPSSEVLQDMCGSDSVSADHPGFEMHQKHNRGFALMDQYMERWFGKVDRSDIEGYQLASQVIQAEGIGLGIEAHLRNQPYCMGTMYWQLSDLWPSFSWSGIDWRGNWKALHWKLKDLYANERIDVYTSGDSCMVAVMNHGPGAETYLIRTSLMNHAGEVIDTTEFNLEVKSASAVKHQIKAFYPSADHYVKAELIKADGSVVSVDRTFRSMEHMKGLPAESMSWAAGGGKDKYVISILAEQYLKGVMLESDVEGKFSHNFFDMDGGTTMQVEFRPDHWYNADEPQFTVRTLNGVQHK